MAKKARTVAAPTESEALELALEKLASSGLPPTAFDELRLEALTGAETQARHASFDPVPALGLTYWDPRDLTKPLAARPKWPPFYRLRYLKEVVGGFESVTEGKKKKKRYVQEPDSGVCAYFPPVVDWPTLIKDPDAPLIITEGELKAAKATLEGYPTVGLGGVHNFRSAKLGVGFLPELEDIVWVKRNVYVIFDSDFQTNENVCKALNMLAEELTQRGALVYLVILPDVVEGGKTGLDDFLIESGNNALEALLHQAVPIGLSKPLWRLNEDVVYIHNPGLVLVQSTKQKLAPAAFRDHAYATANYMEYVVRDDGSIGLKAVSASNAWVRWPLRREAGALTYEPGSEQFLEDRERRGIRFSRFNTWPGWGCQPKVGDVEPFLQLIDHLFSGAELGVKEWFLRWCAYPLQYPGTKLFSSALLYGIHHGTGKSLIGYTLGRIYGENFTELNKKDLDGNFNEWAENKQFVLGDDVAGDDKRTTNDMLKKMITQEKLRINIKHVQSFDVPDCINYYFTSNHPDAFFLEDNDRRFFIHEVLVRALPEVFYMEYRLWLDTGGAEAVFDYLLKLPLGDFNPGAPALRTAAKDRMISDVKSDLGSWVARLAFDPDSVLKVGEIVIQGDLFTNKQLLAVYDPHNSTKVTANGLGRELRRVGINQVVGGKPVKLKDGSQDRYYAVRRRDKWAIADPIEISKYLDDVARLAAMSRANAAKY